MLIYSRTSLGSVTNASLCLTDVVMIINLNELLHNFPEQTFELNYERLLGEDE